MKRRTAAQAPVTVSLAEGEIGSPVARFSRFPLSAAKLLRFDLDIAPDKHYYAVVKRTGFVRQINLRKKRF